MSVFPSKSILYAGDGEISGAARYLIAVMKSLEVDFVHVPPDRQITADLLTKRYDGVILSDYASSQISVEMQNRICEWVEQGTGILMLGGWASFSGPYGRWEGTPIEGILPVACIGGDDRVHFPGGAHIVPAEEHELIQGISFRNPPAILGLNDVRIKKNARVLLNAKKIINVGKKLMLDPVEHPLLAVHGDPENRSAALMTDIAPHWCGGLLDWGEKHYKLPVDEKSEIEVGDMYIQFLSSLICWLVRA